MPTIIPKLHIPQSTLDSGGIEQASAGTGDMTKAVYDPNEDGVIAAAQLTGVATTPLAQADVTNLVTDLSGKEPANANIQSHVISAHAPSNAQKNSDITKAEIEAVLTGEISSHTHAGGGSFQFPVGSYYFEKTGVNPGTTFGYGTWVQAAEGQFIVGQKSTDTDFDVAGETGGAKTHTHADHSGYSHAQDTAAPKWWDTAGGDSKPDAHPAQSHDSSSHLPPFWVMYCWERTA